MRFKLMALAAATVLTVPGIAQSADSATSTPKPKKEKKICRTDGLTGTRLGGGRTCHTAAEWTQIDNANARATEDAVRASRSTGG